MGIEWVGPYSLADLQQASQVIVLYTKLIAMPMSP
jgi:hypothetical protein